MALSCRYALFCGKAYTCSITSVCSGRIAVFLVLMATLWSIQSTEAFGTFRFDIHHRFSDALKGVLDFDGLPQKGTVEYYAAMAHRDRIIRGRYLADTTPITFADGNATVRIAGLGYLYYANVTVGTPGAWFLVALDTGSDLFWLPCNCANCAGSLLTRSGQQIDLNVYNLNTSSTSTVVPCNSTMCGARRRCSDTRDACAYQVAYLSNGTSSAGILVEDVLRLATDDSQQKAVDAPITLGCGITQTGGFLNGAAPNGLFGLGMNNISVPSMLASKGLASNSFSMCFGTDGIGRMEFGDKGSSDQRETPFNLQESHPTYNISITQITVEENVTDVNFTAIFDSGTSFTYVNDPAYSVITDHFNALVQHPRHQSDASIPFEYCYDLSPTETSFAVPNLNLTMNGGNQFFVNRPVEIFDSQGGGHVYCLGVVKSGDVNILGQNFMTGYRVVFDREKMVLGWKESNCYDAVQNNGTSNTLPINRRNSTGAPTPSSVVPEATSGRENGSPLSTSVPPPPSAAPDLNSFACTFMMVLLSFIGYYFIILPS